MIDICSWKFQIHCPRMWSGLRETPDPNVRLCESCLEHVYRCHSEAEVSHYASQGKRVAIGFIRGNELLGKVINKPP